MSCKRIFVVLVSTIAVFIRFQSDENDNDCNFLINEINIGTPGHIKNQDFIELKMACYSQRKTNSLQGYKVIGMSVGPNSIAIDLVVNLWNQKLKSEYYTIGSSNIANADLKPNSPYLNYKENSQETQTVCNHF